MKSFWEIALELESTATSFAVVTVLDSRGSAPQDPGAKAIVTTDGLHWGTVGGGRVEARAIMHAQQLLAKKLSPHPEVVTWNLQKDIGMSCGGEITYLFEAHQQNPWKIAIFGAGHVSQAVVRTLDNLNCQMLVIESRAEWLEKLPNSKRIKKILTADMPHAVSSLDERYYFITLTQGHSLDLPILKQIFTLFPNAPFIGTIGSRVKGLKLKRELGELGIAENVLADFHCPVGFPIGKNHPFEIAISVSAQLLQARDQQSFLTKDNDAKMLRSTSGEMPEVAKKMPTQSL